MKFDLSPTQLGMLIHGSDRASGAYIQQMLCSLSEDLNVPALEKAWAAVVSRHAVFRTSFHLVDSQPFQQVHPQVKFAIANEDWRAMTADEQQESLTTYLANDRQRGFELTEAPLIRIALFRVADARYEMVWTSHHAVMDGRSRRLVLKELFAFYDAYRDGENLELDQPRPYSDYISWLKQYDLGAAEKFWRHELGGFTAPTFVDLGGNRSDQRSAYATAEAHLPENLTASLKQFAEHAGVTLNTLVQGSWAILLSRYTGEDDIVFGATRACRRSAVDGAESMVGLFINTLPVRVRVPASELITSWLQRLRASQVAVREYEHTPLGMVQAWSDVPRGTSLFESIVVFENDQLSDALQSQGGEWKNRKFRLVEQTNYPLVLNAYGGQQLLLKLEYDAARFDPKAVERMLGHLTTLLQGMVDGAQLRIKDLPLLTDAEKRQLTYEWQGKRVEFRNECIHQLFEQQAERTPGAPALVFEDETLTYAELNAKSNQVAHYLRKLGIGPESLVGICMERSPLMVIGMLGIMKAGGAYVPLDPAYPAERLRFMVEDAAARVVLTQRKLLSTIPESNATPLCLDEWESIGGESETVPNFVPDPENLAYVIYTSGSTGKPKGVAIQHRSVAAFITWARSVFSPEELQGVLASTSISFDLSVFELFVTLSAGGCAILADNALHLATLKSAERVTLINTVPSAIAELLRARAIPETVKTINLAGEPLKTELVKQIYELSHVERVFDLYGPAEDTTYSTFTLRSAAGPETIGRPIANTQVYLLDADLHLVPQGATGEIYLAGEGLARGYLNRPDLTAERFAPNPFNSDHASRLYRTGDLARYLDDGNLQYLGRVDHQVKIRGYRIELKEIERTIERHPDIRQCAVIATGDDLNDKKLVAYVVTQNGQRPETTGIREFLQAHLPTFMLPTQFVAVDEMPLTPSGKIDRRALPKAGTQKHKRVFEAPRTAVEEKLADMWSSILKLERVGVHDNFFDLGGHSLLAFQLISRVRDDFKVELPLRRVFETPTVAGLSRWISEAADERRDHAVPALKALPRQRRQSRLSENG